ncbi:hypothetical protein Tco_1006755 [Tanacetum coccineum]|uniref:Uncharacterized protein n=1 Tax=Tanacetum coccineum TaxID=301880 RepID=A0ABQ5FKJ6_9ASTR
MASHLKGVKKTTMRRQIEEHYASTTRIIQVSLKSNCKNGFIVTMVCSANTSDELFRHCKLRSTDNMTFENSDEGGESTQELQNLIKELGYRNAMDVEDVLTHPEENVVAQLLTDEEIIESVIGINKDDIDEEDDESSTMEPPSRNEAIKSGTH